MGIGRRENSGEAEQAKKSESAGDSGNTSGKNWTSAKTSRPRPKCGTDERSGSDVGQMRPRGVEDDVIEGVIPHSWSVKSLLPLGIWHDRLSNR